VRCEMTCFARAAEIEKSPLKGQEENETELLYACPSFKDFPDYSPPFYLTKVLPFQQAK
jgi:hypothetical protein